jgi:DNA processing protein
LLLANLFSFSIEKFLADEAALMTRHEVRRVTWADDPYPSLLREIPDAPVAFYVAGELPLAGEDAIAIVGSRTPSLYGVETAGKLAMDLAEKGITVVSGLARGIDTAAHQGALRAKGRTVAVLGCGIDVVYPAENKDLYAAVRRSGCIISEFPFGTVPDRFNFPRRNRIVSGLSRGVVVVEANVRSGALITARLAGEQGRDVFAVPGRVDNKMSAGPHALLKQGAKVVMSVEDILEELNGESSAVSKDEPLTEEETRLLALIRESDSTLAMLEENTGIEGYVLMGPLLSLEIKGLIRERPGKVFEMAAG